MRVTHAGICHTDLACHAGHIPARRPVVLGHEGAGVVVAAADDVESIAVGTPVVMSLMSCGRCDNCLTGDVAYCAHSVELNILGGGAGGRRTYADSDVLSHFFGQSSFATYSVAHERSLVPAPSGFPLELAAPLACGVMTGAGTVLNALRVRPGESVVVFGAGAVGLAAAAVARISGAAPVVVVDLVESRLDLASAVGADHVVNARETDVVAAVKEITDGGANHTIEASGNATALRQAIDALRPRGSCAVVGAGHGAVEIDTRGCRVKGTTIRGVSMGDANPKSLLPYLMDEVTRGRLPLGRLVRTYPFDDIALAFEDAQAGRTVKPVLVMPAP
ncbi:zinc-binding dehydrogenase [Streptosporangium sp. CA-115845]|uniref:zinc-binding dehydrogenase n=1 Tax=Streptosporangium sp. CA-115845 TaxID=3240071 RepID=UPI003D8F421E